jgi:hypothetical protein
MKFGNGTSGMKQTKCLGKNREIHQNHVMMLFCSFFWCSRDFFTSIGDHDGTKTSVRIIKDWLSDNSL